MPLKNVVWRERWFWGLLAFVATMGVVFMPREMYPGDPVTVREETRAILLHGELAVEPFVAKHYAETQEKGQYVVEHPTNGRSYSKYGSMLAFAYILPMAAEWFIEGDLPAFDSPRRVIYLNAFNILMSLLIAASLYRTARRFDAAPWGAAVFVGLCFYTTYLWNYLRVQNTDIFQLLCFSWAVTGFIEVLDARQKGRSDWAAVLRLWLACNALLLTRLAYVFVGPCFAAGLLCDRISRGNTSLAEAVFRETKSHVLPALAGLGALAAFNTVKFGSPWLSGYHAWARGQALDQLFSGDLFEALFHLAFSAQWGLPYLFPVLCMAVPLMPSWLRRHAIAYGTILLVMAVSTVLVASRVGWRGEMTYGPRYWIFIAPFLALPATRAIAWMSTPTMPARLAAAATAVVLWYSASEQTAVNRHSFFAYYYISSPLENALTMDAARFFATNSFGYVTKEMERKFPDNLTWWSSLKPKLRTDAAGAYENHVRQVLGQSNLFWFP